MTRSRFGLGMSEGRRKARRGEPELSADEHRLLRDLVSERLGISFASESRTSLERKLRGRLTALGLTSFSDYYQLLRYNPLAAAEWDEAIELLTTHETYFFREDVQLRAFRDELLPMLADRLKSRRRFVVWSAGCSTGEETYTVAMLVLESRLFDGWDVHIYGSDLSKRCIAAARRATYGPTSFRATPEDARRKWFVPAQRGVEIGEPFAQHATQMLRVRSAVRALCHFGQMNVLDEERTHRMGRYDVIFCRNVLIYFDESARQRVIQTFHERLNPGGVLLLGHAESLLHVSTAFELLHLKEDLVYRKPATVAEPTTR